MLARFWAKQDPHSLYLAAAGALFGFTLVLDLSLRTDAAYNFLNWVLLIIVAAGVIAVLSLGSRFPPWIGSVSVALFIAVSLIFLSPLGDEQVAVSSAQELPIAALYLGWFVGRPLGRWLMILIAVLLSIVMAINPLFHPEGVLGATTAVQIIIVNLLCFEVGSTLWRQSERRLSTDTLTSALSRKAFFERLAHELSKNARELRPRSLILIDFDGFKELNDRPGHAQGDAVLVSSVAAWRAELRKTDVIGRIGGDEFALLIDGNDPEDGELTARRLLAASPHGWSWGLAPVQADDTVDSLFLRADSELYSAKLARQ